MLSEFVPADARKYTLQMCVLLLVRIFYKFAYSQISIISLSSTFYPKYISNSILKIAFPNEEYEIKANTQFARYITSLSPTAL